MKQDRMLVVQAVLSGKLGAEHLTKKELVKIQIQVVHMAMEKEIEKLQSQGKYVYQDDYPLLH